MIYVLDTDYTVVHGFNPLSDPCQSVKSVSLKRGEIKLASPQFEFVKRAVFCSTFGGWRVRRLLKKRIPKGVPTK